MQIRKIIIIIAILILAGCSGELDAPNEDTQNPHDENTDISEIAKREDNESPWLVGAINGDLKIHMKLYVEKNKVAGVYYYDDYKKNINLSGDIYNNNFSLYEEDAKGSIDAIFITDELIEGVWHDDKNIYPIYLIKEGSNIPIPQAPDRNVMKWKNSWKGKNLGFYSGSELTITPVFNNLMRFDISAFDGTHSGGFLSLALIEDDTAVYKGENDTYLKFILKEDGDIYLDTNDYNYYCGMGVEYDSVYTEHKVEAIPPTAMEVGLVYSEEQERIFKELTGEHYKDFINYAQYYSEEEEVKEVGFSVRYFGLRGYFNAAIVMINQTDNTILAAVEWADAIYYFANNKAYTNPPDTIKIWCEEKTGMKIKTIVLRK